MDPRTLRKVAAPHGPAELSGGPAKRHCANTRQLSMTRFLPDQVSRLGGVEELRLDWNEFSGTLDDFVVMKVRLYTEL